MDSDQYIMDVIVDLLINNKCNDKGILRNFINITDRPHFLGGVLNYYGVESNIFN